MTGKNIIINAFGKNKIDTGNSEVQIAIITNNIYKLQIHLKKNKYDYHSQLGMTRMVNKRRKLLTYLKKTQVSRYKHLVKTLKLRHK
ncbi:30S ribosomal protein S15 [Candidatus Portiera aleyrodidarum]|uniref:Small ribosomal subunit protein uS15 n=1 Tax=Candidatus Portiera aleyrodidarum MED (Bemisia tabaci) TaxID=1163752 RepID=A0AAU8RQT0_9GAMM|nr:30S ribosomal protein S15 [Candidatus Portiera aleyrodidarum]AFQ24101.1 ribosomal protein S15 [Candidatus Portiera aleyrodidarum BT-B-HRs]AFS18864.1 30S ribosomal protein S15 [Candidatus Portiera aleyrodidarum BT-QVLC]AFT80495.1 SSU ribosomal protein S15p (S13e) [Candidatus Portiera aleyrodidarum BT-QVLC]AFT80775.1 SSU ribosomal protein S15p (S13e) [Candidatus Portiera aleyrodidarum BT-B-HRs]AJF24077.1 30S ribosomal protein S15 [Candidatus Portiera aleyrodidarum MED (Bemisia tabaci)]